MTVVLMNVLRMMMKYPKIHSLWKRHGWYFEEDKKKNPDYQSGRQSFIEGDYAIPEFGNIKKWLVQEKIDGTNIRIMWKLDRGLSVDSYSLEFAGRTDNALIPKDLGRYLGHTFTRELMLENFPIKDDEESISVILFGEGYGPKIQKGGGNYRNDVGFILFDVYINGWWLQQSSVKDIADKLGIPYAPIIGIMTEYEIVSYVKSHPDSLCSITQQVMEGIIARPEPLVLLRDGTPLMMKLKCKEFEVGHTKNCVPRICDCFNHLCKDKHKIEYSCSDYCKVIRRGDVPSITNFIKAHYTCLRCKKVQQDGCYYDGVGWLCDRHGDQWMALINIYLDEKEGD